LTLTLSSHTTEIAQSVHWTGLKKEGKKERERKRVRERERERVRERERE